MSKWADVPWDQLLSLFSVVICLDKTMRIVFSSDTALRYLPDLASKPLLKDTFEIRRPGRLGTYADAIAAQGSLCLITALNEQFAIRGQMIRSTYDDEEVMCLFGAPWLFWMSGNCPDVRLRLDDFSPQDVQLDQLFFMTTEKRMVGDLETLNTELIEAKDELQETHDAQHRFFAQMSHEMRTPLNGVVSALSLLESNDLNDTQRQLCELAEASSRNLMEVINYVLDLSKLELAGEDEETGFNLEEMIRSTLDILGAKAREKSLELKLELGEDIPLFCIGNAPRLRQILLNLTMNAIKFTDKGSVTIRVLNVAEKGVDCTLKFSVADTGIGMTNATQEQIFEPFWSLQIEGEEHPDAGTGLGLDIVRRNVELAGGVVGVTSELGVGSTFWFDWPTVVERRSSIISTTTTIDSVTKAASNIDLSGRVLLVDDNQTNLLLGAMILESMGVAVDTAENGEAAVAEALQGSFDLVLMDVHMPDFDGLEATRRIRKVKDKQILPIVALTALAYEKEKDACIASGMNGYLTKPIIKEALAAELAKWLRSEDQDQPKILTERRRGTEERVLEMEELLDLGVLKELEKQIGSDNLQVVLKKVNTEAAQRWEDLKTSSSLSDHAAIQRHVHSLSSIFRSVGLTQAGERLGEIEAELRAGKEMAPGWLEEFDRIRVPSINALIDILDTM